MLNVYFINYERGKMLPGNSSLQLKFLCLQYFVGGLGL